jgi:hypothetical protein
MFAKMVAGVGVRERQEPTPHDVACFAQLRRRAQDLQRSTRRVVLSRPDFPNGTRDARSMPGQSSAEAE